MPFQPRPIGVEPIIEDQIGYCLSASVYFARKEDAEAVAKFCQQFTLITPEYVPGPGYKQQWQPLTDVGRMLQELKGYSRELAQTAGDQIRRYDAEKKRFDEEKGEYDRASRDRGKVAEQIERKIAQAKRADQTRCDLRAAFVRYLELAEGNQRIACKFMQKAYPDALRMIPECFAGIDDPNKIVRAYNLQPAQQPPEESEEL